MKSGPFDDLARIRYINLKSAGQISLDLGISLNY